MSDPFIHPSAVVDDGAVVGPGSKVWHFVHVMSGARIGGGCVIGQGCYIGNVTIGDNVKIQNNVSVYDGVTLEDDVFCGPSCVFTNVINPRAAVPRKDEYRPTLVRRGASIGANATIVCGATIGEHAFIGAGAVVRGDVAPHALMVGVPARRIGWSCACGVRLPDATGAVSCPGCGAGYEVGSDGVVAAGGAR
jgi:UDP-2-acetamido-3-amino-2,3-dideoxy-glucuronate N-acetyltransferase